jgi:hypothetical protein
MSSIFSSGLRKYNHEQMTIAPELHEEENWAIYHGPNSFTYHFKDKRSPPSLGLLG